MAQRTSCPRGNQLAAQLSITAGLVLSFAICSPFVAVEKFSEKNAYSLLGGIAELFHRGHVFVGLILLVFSVVFPLAKLAMILVASSSLVQMPRARREELCRIATLAGKYSMLDVLAVAVMIVVVKVDGMVEVSPSIGVLLFTIGIALSMLAGMATDFSHLREEA